MSSYMGQIQGVLGCPEANNLLWRGASSFSSLSIVGGGGVGVSGPIGVWVAVRMVL